MIEKTPVVRQISQIAKYTPLWASHAVSGKHQCRGFVLGPSASFLLQVPVLPSVFHHDRHDTLRQIRPNTLKTK